MIGSDRLSSALAMGAGQRTGVQRAMMSIALCTFASFSSCSENIREASPSDSAKPFDSTQASESAEPSSSMAVSPSIVTVDIGPGGLSARATAVTLAVRGGCVGMLDSRGAWTLTVFPANSRLTAEGIATDAQVLPLGVVLDLDGGLVNTSDANNFSKGLLPSLTDCGVGDSFWLVKSGDG